MKVIKGEETGCCTGTGFHHLLKQIVIFHYSTEDRSGISHTSTICLCPALILIKSVNSTVCLELNRDEREQHPHIKAKHVNQIKMGLGDFWGWIWSWTSIQKQIWTVIQSSYCLSSLNRNVIRAGRLNIHNVFAMIFLGDVKLSSIVKIARIFTMLFICSLSCLKTVSLDWWV